MIEPIWKEPAVGRTVGVVGDVYRFLATGAETGGEYALFEAIVAPGAGPPPHIHTREVESFYVIDGEITFSLGDESPAPRDKEPLEKGRSETAPRLSRRTGRAGTFVSIPLGTLHAFKNESDSPAKMLIWVAPAGLEQMFAECGVELPEGTTTTAPPTPAEIEKLLAIAPEYGVEILVPEGGKGKS